eukprot:SAG31_NODE_40646_length_279_cov_1.855556_2_plen_27_part_01
MMQSFDTGACTCGLMAHHFCSSFRLVL